MTSAVGSRTADSRLLRLYLVAVVGAGVAVSTAEVLRLLGDGATVDHAGAIALFAGLMLLGELRPVWMGARGEQGVVVSLAFACALAFVAPGYLASLVAAAVSVTADATKRIAPVKVAFNAACTSLSVLACTAVLAANGIDLVDGAPRVGPLGAVVVVLACAAVYVTNLLLTATVLALHQHLPLVEQFRNGVNATLLSEGVLMPLGPVLVVLWVWQPWLLPLGLALSAIVFGTTRFAMSQRRDLTRDPLTGLANRRQIDEDAEAVLTFADRNGRSVAALLMDLDGFKPINDGFGHAVGDEVLVAVAERARAVVGEEGALGRLGGDEFLVFVEVDGAADALALAERLGRAVAEPLIVDDAPLAVAGSVGVAVHPLHGRSVAELTRAADAAMYQAKRDGSGAVLADAPRPGGESPLLVDLERALAAGGEGLDLHYQPVLDVRTGAVVGIEGLLRWTHPSLGAVPPGAIVPQAETTSVTHVLTSWVLEHAVAFARGLHDAGHRVWTSVNVSPRDVADPAFADRVAAALDRHGLDGRWLVVEITETATWGSMDRTSHTCRRLRQLGVGVALDDFGVGQRSVVDLRDLPVSVVKLDRSIIANADGERGRALFGGLVGLAARMGVATVAEGIDSTARLEAARAAQCEQMQGYQLARPMPAPELRAWLDGRASLDARSPSRELAARAGVDVDGHA